jgi:hypothetical protein
MFRRSVRLGTLNAALMDLSAIDPTRREAVYRLGRRWLLIADLAGAITGAAIAVALIVVLVV